MLCLLWWMWVGVICIIIFLSGGSCSYCGIWWCKIFLCVGMGLLLLWFLFLLVMIRIRCFCILCECSINLISVLCVFVMVMLCRLMWVFGWSLLDIILWCCFVFIISGVWFRLLVIDGVRLFFGFVFDLDLIKNGLICVGWILGCFLGVGILIFGLLIFVLGLMCLVCVVIRF